MKPHKHCEIIKAWAEGAEIQYREDSSRMWTDIINPLWDVMFEYRIKPRTVKREGWIAIYGDIDDTSYLCASIFNFEDVAKQKCPSAKAVIKVEWTEEVERCLK